MSVAWDGDGKLVGSDAMLAAIGLGDDSPTGLVNDDVPREDDATKEPKQTNTPLTSLGNVVLF